MNTKKIGVLAVLGASLMWALEPVFAKLAYKSSDFLQTAATRSFVIVFIALLYIFITNRGNLKLKKTQFSKIFYIAIFATIFGDTLFYYALTKTAVVNAMVISQMQPIFIVLLGFLFLREQKLTKFDYIGILIMIFAGLLVSTRTLENLFMFNFGNSGDLIVLLAVVGWAISVIIMSKYLRTINAGIMVFYRFLIASIIFLIYLVFTSNLFVPNIYQILIGIFVGIGQILIFEGLKRIKAAQVTALELSAPFFAAILAFFILGEIVTVMQILGIALLIFGVYLLSRKEDEID